MFVNRRVVFVYPLAAALTALGCGQETDQSGAPGEVAEDPTGEAQQGLCVAPPYDEFIAMNGVSARWTQLPSGLSGTDVTSQLTALVANLPTTAATGGASTLYIPPGTYYLHSTLQLVDGFGVNIVGDDPATTTIVWTGAAGGDMLRMVDDGYSKVSRLTFDGGGTARALVDVVQSACYSNPGANAQCNLPVPSSPNVSGAGGTYFLEFNDDVFKNAQFGVVGDFGVLSAVQPEWCAPWDASTANCGPGGTAALCCYGNPNGPVYTPPAAGVIPALNSNLGNFVIRRSTFSGLSSYGIVTANQNALDWLVADSRFYNIGFGGPAGYDTAAIGRLYNGSYVLTNNSFASNNRDVVLHGPAADVIRGNTSINSNAFLWAGGGSWNYELDVSGNYIVTSGGFVSNAGSGECAWPGFPPYGICVGVSNLTLLDNYINVPNGVGVFTAGTTPELVEGGNSMAVGNQLISPWNGYPQPLLLSVAPDTIGAGAPVPAAAQYAYNSVYAAGTNYWGATPAKSTRTVYNIQSLFADCTSAAGNCGSELSAWLTTAPQNIAVYFPAVFQGTSVATYYLKTPIDVPAGLDVTFFGDGVNSKVEWVGAAGAASDPYMIHFKAGAGLSPVGSVRDMELVAHATGKSRPGGILVDVLDNTGDMVFVDTVAAGFTKSLIDLVGVDKTSVRADQSGGGNERMIGVTGGGAGVNGSGSTAGVVMFGGGGATSGTLVDLRNWGKAVLIGTDNEGRTQGVTLAQSGYLTMDGGRLVTGTVQSCGSAGQPPTQNGCCSGLFNQGGICKYAFATQPHVVVQSTFKGTATFANLDDGAGIFSSANPQAKVLSLSNGFATDYNQYACTMNACTFTQQNPGARAALNQMSVFNWDLCSPVSYYWCEAQPSAGGGANPTLPPAGAASSVAAMLADLRAVNEAPPARACGLANVRLHRLYFEGTTTGNPADFMRTAIRVQHN